MTAQEYAPNGRVLTIKPSRSVYSHYPIITVVDGYGMTEMGELIDNLPLFAFKNDAHLWVCAGTSAELFSTMYNEFGESNWFAALLTESELESEPGIATNNPIPKFNSFGFHRKIDGKVVSAPDRRRTRRHRILDTQHVSQDLKLMEKIGYSHSELMEFAQDFRSWFKGQDLPIPTTLGGAASRLLKDGRFWSYTRGQVPRATNEKVRPHLPGNLHIQNAKRYTRYDEIVSLDLKRAYHYAAMRGVAPDPTSLVARGWFNSPQEGRIYAQPGSVLYKRWIKQPGLVCLLATSRPARTDEIRPPACDRFPDGWSKPTVVYVYTNELETCVKHGLLIRGLIAAWTADTDDKGLRKYAEFAVQQNNISTSERSRWLKPMLLTGYGLYATRARNLYTLTPDPVWGTAGWIAGVTARMVRRQVPTPPVPVLCNVLTFGCLQSAIRTEMIREANRLQELGAEIVGIHADAIHTTSSQLDLDTDKRFVIMSLTNTVYCEGNSAWVSDQGECLPGLHGDDRLERLRRYGKIVSQEGTRRNLEARRQTAAIQQ